MKIKVECKLLVVFVNVKGYYEEWDLEVPMESRVQGVCQLMDV